MKIPENIVNSLILSSITILILVVLLIQYPLTILSSFLIYIFTTLLIMLISKKCNFRFLKVIKLLLVLPICIGKNACKHAIPLLTLIFHIIHILCLLYILPTVILLRISDIFLLYLKLNTIIFISLTLGSILSITLNKKLRKCSYKLLNIIFADIYTFTNNKYSIKQWICSFHKKENFIVIIYSLYFIILLYTSLSKIQSGTSIITKGIEYTILQSFIVFFAYVNAIDKIKAVSLNMKLLNRIYSNITK